MLVILMAGEPLLLLRPALVRDDRAAEIDRLAVLVQHHLRGVRVEQRLDAILRLEGFDERSQLRSRVIEASAQTLYLLRLDEGFIALDIHDHSPTRPRLDISLEASVRTALVLIGGHHHLAAESGDRLGDAGVVRRHIDAVQHLGDLLIHTLDHTLPADLHQRLARETGGGISGRDYPYKNTLIHNIFIKMSKGNNNDRE